ncbi:restriction endonuclease subunit S [Sulfurimonas sp.]|uniref:restriction endonuclease subunit S n=1 Tax=Sulfurimonas sp. TaxID=2022749 RepID=UPI00356289E5
MSNVPKLRFKEFSEEWEEKSLKDLTKINQGLQIQISDRFTEQVENSYFYITNEFLKETSSNKYFIKNPPESVLCTESDVLMTRTGNTGQVVTNVNGAFHNNFFKIKYSDDLNKDFLVEFLRLRDTQNMILRYAGTSTIPDLNHGDFYRLKINLPSKQEQEKIASFLTSVDTKIEQLTKKEELLKQYKKGVMQQIFSQEIRFQANDGSEFEDWYEKKLGDILISSRLGGNYANSEKENSTPLIKMGNLDRGKILLNKIEYIEQNETIDDKDLIQYGDLFFNTRNTLDLVGKVAAWRNELPIAYYNSNLMLMKFENNFFMNYRLNSFDGIKALRRIATGTTSVAAIYTKDLLKVTLSIPSLEEQTKIANFISSIDSKIEQVSAQLDSTKEFKKALLQQMFV